MYDIVVIGAGTAGLSAAIYAVRAGKRVLVLEGKAYGGQIINTPSVENYPGIKNVSGFEFATNLYEQAIELGADVKYDKVIKIVNEGETKLVVVNAKYNVEDIKGIQNFENVQNIKDVQDIEGFKAYKCRSIIIATGTVNRKLGLDREDELVGQGVSYCATCDGAFYRGRDVAVVGGGSTALEDAGFLASYCNKVYLIHRRDEFRGEDTLVRKLKEKDNVEFILNSKVVKLEGKERLESIEIEGISKLEDIKSIAKIEPIGKLKGTDTQSRSKLEIAGLFVAIGQVPSNEIFKDIVELDDYGYIVATEDCKTNVDGIYVAGDCRTKKVRQLTTAAADGAVAGLAACEYIG